MKNSNFCIVLIRGLLREARHWGDFPGLLQQQYPDAQILCPDIPGNGSLNHLTSPNTIPGMTDALRKQVSTHTPIYLIAISMGGMIAIDWMNRYPTEVNSAVLINTSLANFNPFYQRLRWQNYHKIIPLLFASRLKREKIILALTSNKHANNSKLLAKWQQWQMEISVSASSAINQLRASASYSTGTKPEHPMLFISSSADRLVDYHCSLKLQNNWHKDYQQHTTAGHDLPLDDPDWLLVTISQWFQ
ncbi:alpha/beta fold hydrolase [Methyloprofundus sp.]|uniref:alpha/beta fold hydrolase n=1 Tax=Methyloprofundus sp. TaxID=2020875 RepID=UPI003D0B1CDE